MDAISDAGSDGCQRNVTWTLCMLYGSFYITFVILLIMSFLELPLIIMIVRTITSLRLFMEPSTTSPSPSDMQTFFVYKKSNIMILIRS